MVCQMTDVQILVLFVGCLVAAWLQLVCWCVAVMILDRYIITTTWCFCVFYTEKATTAWHPQGKQQNTRLLCVPLSLLFVAFIAFSVLRLRSCSAGGGLMRIEDRGHLQRTGLMQLHVTTSLSTGGGPVHVSCTQSSVGVFQLERAGGVSSG